MSAEKQPKSNETYNRLQLGDQVVSLNQIIRENEDYFHAVKHQVGNSVEMVDYKIDQDSGSVEIFVKKPLPIQPGLDHTIFQQ